MRDKYKYSMIFFIPIIALYSAAFFIIKFNGKTNIEALKELGIVALILTCISIGISIYVYKKKNS